MESFPLFICLNTCFSPFLLPLGIFVINNQENNRTHSEHSYAKTWISLTARHAFLRCQAFESKGNVGMGLKGPMDKDFGMARLVCTVFKRVFASVYESVAMETEQQISTTLRKSTFIGVIIRNESSIIKDDARR